jgi:long-chain acyl-CoA synthetase
VPLWLNVEHLRGQKQFVLTPNHLSFLDPFAIGAALDDVELRRTCCGDWSALLTRNPLNRLVSAGAAGPGAGGYLQPRVRSGRFEARGKLVWFPEGQRAADGKLQSFKPGSGMLLHRFPVPVVPVSIRGADEAILPGKFLPHFKRITVVFGEPLNPRALESEGTGRRPATSHRKRSARSRGGALLCQSVGDGCVPHVGAYAFRHLFSSNGRIS